MVRTKATAQKLSKNHKHKREQDGEPRKKRRWRANTVAMREIRRYQRSTNNLIPREAARRLVKELLHSASTAGDTRMTRNAFEMLHSISSTIITDTLGAAERVRAAEKKTKSIRERHVRVGRSMIGVACLSDAQRPIEMSCCTWRRAKKRLSDAVPSAQSVPVALEESKAVNTMPVLSE